ncbi:glutamyl endopeptidase [Rubripirellula amarantea]|nr:glutamyl endopeptidase [Rubripirellula amarantea]
MSDPNDRSRRRRQNRDVDDFGPYDHPTLTPRGYELMRGSPLKDESYQMPLAGLKQGDHVQPLKPGSDAQNSYAVPSRSAAAKPGQYFKGMTPPPPLFNVLPSRMFPDPNVLMHGPLDRYYKSWSLAGASVRNNQGSSPRSSETKISDSANDQLRAIGRMVIHIDHASWDQPAFGSAWIAGPSLVATCAHNLFDSNKRHWSRAIEFYPGFDYYTSGDPISCNVTACYIPKSYLDNPATNDDIGFCYVDRNIGDIIGATIPIVPPETNHFFDDNEVTIMGYPAGAEFDFGKSLWASKGEYLFGRSSGPNDDYSPVLATNFGGGCSGCPWLARDPSTGRWNAVGLSSGHARLHYRRGELNLMSLTSPMLTQRRMDRLVDNQVFHSFEA